VAAGAAAAVAAAVVLANLVRGKVPGLTLLLVLAVPTLVAGQLWAVAIILGRKNWAEGGPPKRWFRSTEQDPRRFFFEGLPLRRANALLAIAFLSWLAAITAFPSLISGGPAAPTPRCRYRLVSHGDYTCVSRSTYISARDAEQRLVAGILCGFFVVQFGVAAAELRRRRVAARQALA
jgi:hypothetical protein